MTNKEILRGLEYRIKSLEEARDILVEKEVYLRSTVDDYESRIDELHSLYRWIKEF